MKKQEDISQPQQLSCFWLCAGLLAALAASNLSRDITRPFYGLHSWGQAHFAWVARSHVKYGLRYTKGFDTFAVGDPPTENPTRYLDHPQLPTLLDATAMLLFGINTWALRIAHMSATIATLLIFLKILRGLVDDTTALLAGLFFSLFPLTAYFGTYNAWLYPVVMTAFWCYLTLIKSTKDSTNPTKFHKYALAISLFLALQLTWEGFFWALGIGIHYVFHCIHRKKMPDKTLLSILILAPALSLILDFTILIGANNWDFARLFQLAKIRATSGELGNLTWTIWAKRFWEHATTNFTLPVLIAAILYLTVGQLYVFAPKTSDSQTAVPSRRFPQFWLFLMPPAFQLLILRGTLYPHQYWERPLAPFLAIACALGVMALADILSKIHRRLAVAASVAVVAVLLASCVMGTNFYYSIRWRAPQQIEMFQMLNEKIPPDKALLSFEPHVIDQFPGVKAASYRPEVAWYLDRDVVPAQTIQEIEKLTATGKFPYYLMPTWSPDPRVRSILLQIATELEKKYKWERISGSPGKTTKDGKFLEAFLPDQLIFDLRGKSDTGR